MFPASGSERSVSRSQTAEVTHDCVMTLTLFSINKKMEMKNDQNGQHENLYPAVTWKICAAEVLLFLFHDADLPPPPPPPLPHTERRAYKGIK